MVQHLPTNLDTAQLETVLNLLVEESNRNQVREKCFEPYYGNLKSNKTKVAEGKMEHSEFERLRSVSAWTIARSAFELVVTEKLVNIELDKVRAGPWIARDPHLSKIREALARKLEDKLIMGICRTKGPSMFSSLLWSPRIKEYPSA